MDKITIAALLALACLALTSMSASATTYVVEANGSGDFVTIQDAINAAVDTDIIELGNGTFDDEGNYDIDFLGKAITVRSQSGDPADVTIDCDGSALAPRRGFWFHSGEDDSSILQNVTVVNGYIVDGNGGAILCEGGAAPSITGCVFRSNVVVGDGAYGGAIHMQDPDYFVLTECTFAGNTAAELESGRGGALSVVGVDQAEIRDCVVGPGNHAGGSGGGVYMENLEWGETFLNGCVITDNSASSGAGVYCRTGLLAMDGCTVYWNQADSTPALGGGVYVSDSSNIVRCTFMGNSAVYGAGLFFSSDAGGDVNRCIVAQGLTGGGIHVESEYPERATVQCCDVYGNAAGNYTGGLSDQTGVNDNISADPQFCDEEVGDCRLFDTSPCAPDHSPCSELIGAYDVACDSPVEPSSWGRIKASYE